MLNKALIIRLTTNAQHFRICKQHPVEKRVKVLPIRVALSC